MVFESVGPGKNYFETNQSNQNKQKTEMSEVSSTNFCCLQIYSMWATKLSFKDKAFFQ